MVFLQPNRSWEKVSLKLVEKEAGRETVQLALPVVIRSHYDDLRQISEDIADLGFVHAAAILAERMPKTTRARSGEIGEILATELVEESLGFRVPVRRLRYKDGREMALRGDDFLGLRMDQNGGIEIAKGESKSRLILSPATISEAREVLSRDAGRPTPISILFVADRLLERGGQEEIIGRVLRSDVATKAIPASSITHVLFTVSGNVAPPALDHDFAEADGARPHVIVHLHIPDHQEFIELSYSEALKLGDD